MNNKLIKYENKFNIIHKSIYLLKILEYNNLIQTGGSKTFSQEEFFSLIENKYKNTKNIGSEKYLIILYGPPASGKTHAKNKALEYVKQYLNANKKLSEDDFINVNIDNIIINKKTKPLFVNTVKKFKKKNDELYEKLTKLYQTTRFSTNSGIKYELLLYLSVLLNYNIFVEIGSGNQAYIYDIIKSLSRYYYIPVVIYPFVNDVNILNQRSINRLEKEYRMIKCDSIKKNDYTLVNKMKSCYENYTKLVKSLDENKFIQKYLFVAYNNNDNDNDEIIYLKSKPNDKNNINIEEKFKVINYVCDV